MHWNSTKKLLQAGCDCDILLNASEDEKQTVSAHEIDLNVCSRVHDFSHDMPCLTQVLDLVHEGIMATDMHTHQRVVDGLSRRIEAAEVSTPARAQLPPPPRPLLGPAFFPLRSSSFPRALVVLSLFSTTQACLLDPPLSFTSC